MNEPTETTLDDVEATEPDADPSSKLPLPFDKLVLAGAGAALVAIVAATQRDITTQPNLRGPRWLWHVIASTPPGVLLYGWFGTRGPEFGDLPRPTVQVVTPES